MIKEDSRYQITIQYDENILIINKSLKALEIIKNKKVDTYLLLSCPDVNVYNASFEHRYGSYEKRALLQEEYELLKEVLL